MKTKRFSQTLLASAVLLAVAAPAQAGPIGYSVNTVDDQLYTIDLATGVVTVIGPVEGSFNDVEGLAFQPGTGVLFGLDDSQSSNDRLLTINLTTGAGTLVGGLGFNFSDAGLSFDSDGKLYASSDLGNNGVYLVDPTTGAAIFLGNAGKDPAGLAFFGSTLYGASDDGTDSLVTVNRTTGVSTTVGPLVNMDGDEPGLDFDSVGVLWAVSGDNNQTFTINTTTGLATAVATLSCTGCRFEGLAIPSANNNGNGVPGVPEPASLALLGIGLAGLGAMRRRKV